jgi:hypothetical protein
VVYNTDLTMYRTNLSGWLALTPPVVLLLLLQLALERQLCGVPERLTPYRTDLTPYHTNLTMYRTDLSGRLVLTPLVVLLLRLQLALDERQLCGVPERLTPYRTDLTPYRTDLTMSHTDLSGRLALTPPSVLLMFLQLALDESQLCGVPVRLHHVPY